MPSLMPPPQSRPKDIALQSPITQHHSQATNPGDQTPGTLYHTARAPHIPLGMPCLQGTLSARVFSLLSNPASTYMVQIYVCSKVEINSCFDLHVCMCLFVCILSICLKMEGVGVGGHQISYLIWAASRGVKGATGRLSLLRWKKKTESRRNECEGRWKGGWEGKEEGRRRKWEKKNGRNNPKGCLS